MSARHLRRLRERNELLSTSPGAISGDDSSEDGVHADSDKTKAGLFHLLAESESESSDDDEADDVADGSCNGTRESGGGQGGNTRDDGTHHNGDNELQHVHATPSEAASKAVLKQVSRRSAAPGRHPGAPVAATAGPAPSPSPSSSAAQPSLADLLGSSTNMTHGIGLRAFVTAAPQGPSALDRLLVVNHRGLNAENEMARALGGLLHQQQLQQQRDDQEAGNRLGGGGGGNALGAAVLAARQRGGRGVGMQGPTGGRRGHHGSVFVLPDPSWVPAPTKAAGGMSMSKHTATGAPAASIRSFCIELSDEYSAVLEGYAAAAETGDPHSVFEILARTPYCIEALLQLSDYHRTTGQHEAAATYLRQALFVLESILHPSFEPWSAQCRLPLPLSGGRNAWGHHHPNRIVYTLLWRYMQHAGRSGCPDAAFELAKLLLSLQPDGPDADPMRTLLCIDYYALRAGKSHWVVDMSGLDDHRHGSGTGSAGGPMRLGAGSSALSSTAGSGRAAFAASLAGSDIPLVMLPSWCYSRALALFRLECEKVAAGGNLADTSSVRAASKAGIDSDGDLDWDVTPTAAAQPPPTLYSDATFATFDSTRMMVRALLMFPHVLLTLLQSAGISHRDVGTASVVPTAAAAAWTGTAKGGAGHPSVAASPASRCDWSAVYKHALFPRTMGEERPQTSPIETQPLWTPVLERLVSIFVQRHPDLYRHPAVLQWMYTCARLAMTAYDLACKDALGGLTAEEEADAAASASGPLVTGPYLELVRVFGDATMAVAEVHTAVLAREQAYHVQLDAGTAAAAALSRYGRAKVSEYSDNIDTIGNEVLMAAEMGAGNAAGVRGRGGGGGGGMLGWLPGRHGFIDLDIASGNPVLLFVASLLPWYALPQQMNDQIGEWRGF